MQYGQGMIRTGPPRKIHRHPYTRPLKRRWRFLEILQGTHLESFEFPSRPLRETLQEVCTRTYVTGFSEETTEKTYSFGPTLNLDPSTIPELGPQVYVVTTETEWKLLFNIFPYYCPRDQLSAWIYFLLFIPRLLCILSYFLHRSFGFFLPTPCLTRGTFVIERVPPPGQAVNLGPLNPEYIRGSEALAAARRAGYGRRV